MTGCAGGIAVLEAGGALLLPRVGAGGLACRCASRLAQKHAVTTSVLITAVYDVSNLTPRLCRTDELVATGAGFLRLNALPGFDVQTRKWSVEGGCSPAGEGSCGFS